MADLQQRLDDLRQRLNGLADNADPAAIGDLEREARALLADAKNTAYESEAQALFAELARASSPTSLSAATIRGLLRRARIRLEIAGDYDDIDEAIDILAEALALDPQSAEVIRMLEDAAAANSQAAQRVTDLFKRYGVARAVHYSEQIDETGPIHTPVMPAAPPPKFEQSPAVRDATRTTGSLNAVAPPPPPQYPTSSGYPPPERDLYAEKPTLGRRQTTPSSDVDSILSELTQAYYAGDYQLVIDLANRVLNQQPANSAALEYRQKAEDNLIRGVVPDHRIPFDARVSYNRANSLVRAGNYDEAERLYREARDLAERAGILTWKDAEQALLDIQDLALARELLNEGDRLMAADQWGEAMRKYEGALRVVPNDPQAEERLEKVRRIQQDAESASVQLTMLGGSLSEQATQLQNIMVMLARLRQLLPNSQRLAQLTADANNRLNGIKTQLNDQAQAALSRARGATALEDRLVLTSEALTLLEQGVKLDPGDSTLAQMLLETRAELSDMQRARQVIERASTLIAQNVDSELVQARSMLSGLLDYAQDARYRATVTDLLNRYLERAVAALDAGDIDEAEALLAATRDEPFNILGRRAEVARIENSLRAMRQRSRIRAGGIIGGSLIIILLVLMGTRGTWEPIVNPPPTETPTPTFTPSETPTPSNTPTPSHTPTETPTPTPTFTPSNTPTETPTPTDTPTPTATSTPTPTPEYLCLVVNVTGENRFVRAQPTTQSAQISVLPPGRVANVIEQRRMPNGQLWYRIVFEIDGATVNGWTLSTNVVQATDCPPF